MIRLRHSPRERQARMPVLLFAGKAADQIRFGLAVGSAVGAQDFVKPHGGLAVNVRMLPGFPRQIGLRLASDESPVDSADVLLLGDGEYRVKRAADGTRHVFGADHRTVGLL